MQDPITLLEDVSVDQVTKADTWEWWNTLRTLCDSDRRLSIG